MAGHIEPLAWFIDGPIALVIGCGDLGMASARVLGKRLPLLVADIDPGRLDAAVAALRHEGFTAEGHVCDIADKVQVERLGALLAEGKGVKVYAHIAAIGRSPRGWRHIMDVSLRGVHLVAQAVAPHLVRGGVAVFMSSIGSRLNPTSRETDDLLDDPLRPDFFERFAGSLGGEPSENDAYQLSKRGVNMLAARLAVEWGPREVRSVTVSPGIADTSMARAGGTLLKVADEDGSERDMTWAEMAAQIVPLGRRGTIPEIAAAVEFLASDAASFITGIDLPVDGGTLALNQPRGTVPTGEVLPVK